MKIMLLRFIILLPLIVVHTFVKADELTILSDQCNSANDKYSEKLAVCKKNSPIAKPTEHVGPGCHDGSWYNLKDRQCYTCPDGYEHNPSYDAGDKNVCQKTLKSKGMHGYKPSSIFEPCKSGYWPQIKDGKNRCFTCPSGYSHFSSYTADNHNVCQKKLKHKGIHKYGFSCEDRGQFYYADTHCYSCPSDYEHYSGFNVSTPGVCHKPGVNPLDLVNLPDGTEWCFPEPYDFGLANVRYGYMTGAGFPKGYVSLDKALDSVDCASWHHDNHKWDTPDEKDHKVSNDTLNDCALAGLIENIDVPRSQPTTKKARELVQRKLAPVKFFIGCKVSDD